MNRLPNAHLAVVDERKVNAYLLSDSHPAGRAKAVFFRRYLRLPGVVVGSLA